jgi:hypothetical protein
MVGMVASQALAAGTISGKLKAPAGFSVDGARVNASDAQFHNFRVETGEDGAFELPDLEAGKYSLVVVGKGLETVVLRDVEVADGQTVTKDLTLEQAKPFPVVKSASPIPLTDDYNSASFADAPEIRIDEAWQIRSGGQDTWTGPTEVSGKLKLKYSQQAFHLAADLSFKVPGINNVDKRADGQQLWNGNSIEFFWQNDPFSLERAEYDLDHNWQVIVALGSESVDWAIHQPGPGASPPTSPPATNILRKEKADKTGDLVRVDMPWSIFFNLDKKTASIAAPADGQLGALDIVINAADFDAPREEAGIKAGLGWGGFGNNWNTPNLLKPIQFVTQAP